MNVNYSPINVHYGAGKQQVSLLHVFITKSKSANMTLIFLECHVVIALFGHYGLQSKAWLSQNFLQESTIECSKRFITLVLTITKRKYSKVLSHWLFLRCNSWKFQPLAEICLPWIVLWLNNFLFLATHLRQSKGTNLKRYDTESHLPSKLGFCWRWFNHFQDAKQARVKGAYQGGLAGVQVPLNSLAKDNHNIIS